MRHLFGTKNEIILSVSINGKHSDENDDSTGSRLLEKEM